MNKVGTKEAKPPAQNPARPAEVKMGAHIDGVSTERRFPRGGKLKVGELLTNCPTCSKPNRMRLFEKLARPTCQHCGEPINRDYTIDKIRFKHTYPTAHEYFRFAPEPGNEHLEDRFIEYYGEEPKIVEAYLPLWPAADGRVQSFDEVKRQLFYQSRQLWSSSGKKCEGDGATAFHLNDKTRKMELIKCPGDECEFSQSKKCRMRGTLNLFLPVLGQAVVVQVDTGSPNNIIEINSALELLYYQTRGQMYQPIRLRVEIAKTRKGNAPFIHVSWPPELNLQMERLVIDSELLALVESGGHRALPEPGEPDPEDLADEYEVPDEEKIKERVIADIFGLVDEIKADGTSVNQEVMADLIRTVDPEFKPKRINREKMADLDITVLNGVFNELKKTYPDQFEAYRKKQADRMFG